MAGVGNPGARTALAQWLYGGQQQLAQGASQWGDKMALYNQILGQQREAAGGLSNLINEYNRAFSESKAQNVAKYKEGLGLFDQVSGQQAADIRSSYTKQRSSALQNLARSGMSGTTVGATLGQGLQREESSSLNRLADAMLKSKTDYMQNFQYAYPEAGITQSAIAALAPTYNYPSL